jgi:hypothetical protein
MATEILPNPFDIDMPAHLEYVFVVHGSMPSAGLLGGAEQGV